MERNVVLIEIEGGRVTAYAPAGTLVALHDRDNEGDYKGFLYTKDNEAAFQTLSRRLGETDYDSPNYVLEVLDSPPFIDWGKEAARMAQMREKAIAYITEEVKQAKIIQLPIETGCTQVAYSMDRVEFSQRPPRGMFRLVTFKELTLEQLIAAARYIQKVTEGGTKA